MQRGKSSRDSVRKLNAYLKADRIVADASGELRALGLNKIAKDVDRLRSSIAEELERIQSDAYDEMLVGA